MAKGLTQQDILELRRQRIISKLDEYAKENGGNVYGWNKKIDKGYLHHLKKDYEVLEDRKISIEEFFSDYLGHEYDLRYKMYKDNIERTRQYADENGCIDSLREARNNGDKGAQAILSKFERDAIDLNMCIFDYVLLMTDYHFSTGFVHGNYVDYVKDLMWQTYPDGNVTRLYTDHKELYSKVMHLSLNSVSEVMSIKDIIENIFGMNADNLSTLEKKLSSMRSEEEIVEDLRSIASVSGDVAGISSDRKLYKEMCNISRGETQQMFLERNNLTNSQMAYRPRFSFVETTYEKRLAELTPVRDNVFQQLEFNFEDMTDRQRFYANLEIAARTVDLYINAGLEMYSQSFYEKPTAHQSSDESIQLKSENDVSVQATDVVK